MIVFLFAFTFLKSSFCLNLFSTFYISTPPYFYSYIVVRTTFVHSGMFLQRNFIPSMSHTLCDVKNFFQLDFHNPAVNTFFTATKIFSHSRFINGWYIGKLFCSFILSISLYQHLVKRKRFLQDNFIILASHTLCDTRKLF